MAGGGGKKRGGARWGAGGACPCAAPARRALAAPAGVACLLCRLLALPPRCLVGGAGDCSPCGTCSPSPGGEDHLKRRSSSPPVPPLLGCRHCSPVPRPNRNAPPSRQRRGASPPSGHLHGRFCKCRRRSNAGDARGGAPCIRKQKNLPLPRRGRGAGGISFPFGEGGQENKLKAGLASDQNNRATQQGNAVAGQAGNKEGKPPLQAPQRQGEQVPVQDTPPAGHPISRDSRYRRDIKYGYPPTYYPYSA